MEGKINIKIVCFYSVASLLFISIAVYLYWDTIESTLDRLSLSWLQNRGLEMSEEEYA